ncbi:MAG: hypothetical protein ACFFEK_13150 [Candidatus Thorarchaeota archaeon]
MTNDKKREKGKKEISASRLLDEFTDIDSPIDDAHHTEMTDEEYVEMMLKKELERKLLRTRGTPLFEITPQTSTDDCDLIPDIPEGSCPSCYFCSIIQRIGDAVYCVCKNPNRVIDGMYYDHRMWVRSEPDIECHKEPPSTKLQKQTQQKIEGHQHTLDQNETRVEVPKGKEQIAETPKFMNYFELLESIEEESEIPDPDIPDVDVHPPPFTRRPSESITIEVESDDSDEIETELEPVPRNEMVAAYFREETIAIHKHKALQTLEKYRRNKPLEITRAKEPPIVSEKITPMKRCENCYFCVDAKRVGGSSWCHCTNLARSTDTTIAASWVRSRLNAPCWRREESTIF